MITIADSCFIHYPESCGKAFCPHNRGNRFSKLQLDLMKQNENWLQQELTPVEKYGVDEQSWEFKNL